MPTSVHNPQSSPIAAHAERSLLRELGLPVRIDAGDVSGHWAHDGCAALFLAGTQQRGLRFVQRREVARRKARLGDPEKLGTVELSWAVEKAHDVVLSLRGGELALLVSHGGACEILVAARTSQAACRAAKELAATLRSRRKRDERVPVRFWTGTGHGTETRRHAIEAPKWGAVAGHYPSQVRSGLDRLIAARALGNGALLLWHGEPGTGKTHALRALVRSWRTWCSAHCVTDPERFLAGTSYLMDVATSRCGEDEPDWRLAVLEDAGELMSATARTDTGQGLSRVLNLTDGMLGQGVKCILLVTTNEPLGRLHPAVHRPGRRWASIDFDAFGPAEATAWLAARGVEREVSSPMTLAQLYEAAEGRETRARQQAAFGYAHVGPSGADRGHASQAQPGS